MNTIRNWIRHYLEDSQAIILIVLVLIISALIVFLGEMLAPVLASIVIAYLLEGLVHLLERLKMPRFASVMVVFMTFLAFLVILLVALAPLLWEQVVQLIQQLPTMIYWVQKELLQLPERYPDLISDQQVVNLMDALRSELTSLGQRILSFSMASVRGLVTILIYIFLVPLLVFFFLKDKDRILDWFASFLPKDRRLVALVWRDVDRQIGNYIRGKVWEILIVWAASYLTLQILGLQFAVLIGFFTGLSVLIPYIGATVMALPVALIGFFQWGWSAELAYVLTAYTIIQILDGNVLATLLLSEVVNLHPIAIIVAILIFGGIWGFWGVFFAIPLATLVQAIINALSIRHKDRMRDNIPQDSASTQY